MRQTPAALPPPGNTGALPNRLTLAQWLVEPDHPLTARVAVNRLWHNFMDMPLVSTMNDFGVQGAPPSHPELLDWLARDFVDSGWDVKRFCRNVVLSATYRQDSVAPTEERDEDPGNAGLARGPSRRLTAGMLRDQALFAAGLLVEEQGGPPVSPYQPENLWREFNVMTPEYQPSVGKDLWRRSLYTVWKRTAPIPNMLAFDAAGREVCSMQRTPTSTPVQALVLLNDPQFVEAARVLAEREWKAAAGDSVAAIRAMFVRLASRPPDPREQQLLDALYAGEKKRFAENPDQARLLLAIGEHTSEVAAAATPEPASGLADVAALAIVAQAILNSDSAVWRR
jgi:hypothetical protein